MKAYVIAMTEVNESVQVANRCIKSAKKFGIDVEVFSAVTPKDVNGAREEKGIPLDGFREKWSRLDNAVSCFMSHYLLWEKCVELNEPILILEHDAVVTNEIPNVPFSGILSLGKPSYGNYVTPPKLGVNKLVSKQYFPGAHAYMIKPSAAKLLINAAKEDARPTDVFLHNNRFGFLEEYYPWPVEARDTFTTVQNRDGIQAKHSYRTSPELYRIL